MLPGIGVMLARLGWATALFVAFHRIRHANAIGVQLQVGYNIQRECYTHFR
jgi:hypothetical protein